MARVYNILRRINFLVGTGGMALYDMVVGIRKLPNEGARCSSTPTP